MTPRPSLQEIADMPHSAAIEAVRAFYDPHWLEPEDESNPDDEEWDDEC